MKKEEPKETNWMIYLAILIAVVFALWLNCGCVSPTVEHRDAVNDVASIPCDKTLGGVLI